MDEGAIGVPYQIAAINNASREIGIKGVDRLQNPDLVCLEARGAVSDPKFVYEYELAHRVFMDESDGELFAASMDVVFADSVTNTVPIVAYVEGLFVFQALPFNMSLIEIKEMIAKYDSTFYVHSQFPAGEEDPIAGIKIDDFTSNQVAREFDKHGWNEITGAFYCYVGKLLGSNSCFSPKEQDAILNVSIDSGYLNPEDETNFSGLSGSFFYTEKNYRLRNTDIRFNVMFCAKTGYPDAALGFHNQPPVGAPFQKESRRPFCLSEDLTAKDRMSCALLPR